MRERISFFKWAGLLAAIVLMNLACAGTTSKSDTTDPHRRLGREEYVASICQMIDDQITWEDVTNNIEDARGTIAKWHGDIIESWNDKILIASRGREENWNHFLLLLDHPLPTKSSVEDLTQTISKGEAIYAVGRIIDRRTIVLESGSDLTIPHLECYIISKENDRQFARPVWVKRNQ